MRNLENIDCMRFAMIFAALVLLASPAHAAIASCYCDHKTANGERMNCAAPTAAHRTRAFNSIVRVTNLANGRSIHVRINDRGPWVRSREIDLATGACLALGFDGLAHVRLD